MTATVTGRRARPPLVVVAAREAARAVLLATPTGLTARGPVVPCLTVPTADAGCWTSDDPDEQAVAAALCSGCAALTPCRAYGAAWPSEAGVYGGQTEQDRRPRVGRPRKTTTTTKTKETTAA